jgi:hypothetical protein
MSQTITEKILAKAAHKKAVHPGDNIWVDVNVLMTHDVCGPGMISVFHKKFGKDAKVWDPERIVIIPDHYVYTQDQQAHKNLDTIRQFAFEQKIKLSLHQADHELWKNLVKQGSMFGFEFGEPRPVDHFLLDEEELKIGDSKFKILHTPGHSPGGLCIRFNEGELAEVPFLFSGDTLFQSSIGRTDLWGGDYKTLIQSIKQRIFTLDEETTVVPGHGFETSIAEERRDNPFLR